MKKKMVFLLILITFFSFSSESLGFFAWYWREKRIATQKYKNHIGDIRKINWGMSGMEVRRTELTIESSKYIDQKITKFELNQLIKMYPINQKAFFVDKKFDFSLHFHGRMEGQKMNTIFLFRHNKVRGLLYTPVLKPKNSLNMYKYYKKRLKYKYGEPIYCLEEIDDKNKSTIDLLKSSQIISIWEEENNLIILKVLTSPIKYNDIMLLYLDKEYITTFKNNNEL